MKSLYNFSQALNESKNINNFPRLMNEFKKITDPSIKLQVNNLFDKIFNAQTYTLQEYRLVSTIVNSLKTNIKEFEKENKQSKAGKNTLRNLEIFLEHSKEQLEEAKPNVNARNAFLYFLEDLNEILPNIEDNENQFKCIGSNLYNFKNDEIHFVLIFQTEKDFDKIAFKSKMARFKMPELLIDFHKDGFSIDLMEISQIAI